jgi:hypothetical protein
MAGITLDPGEFSQFILRVKEWYEDRGSYPTCVVLPEEIEELIENHFFHGKLTDLVSYRTDHRGRIRMHLAGVRVRFCDKFDVTRKSIWVLSKNKPGDYDGTVIPTIGPGNFPSGGGTPMALAA